MIKKYVVNLHDREWDEDGKLYEWVTKQKVIYAESPEQALEYAKTIEDYNPVVIGELRD